MHHQNVFRISTFGKLINIFDKTVNYTLEEQQLFFEGLDFLTMKSNLGVNI